MLRERGDLKGRCAGNDVRWREEAEHGLKASDARRCRDETDTWSKGGRHSRSANTQNTDGNNLTGGHFQIGNSGEVVQLRVGVKYSVLWMLLFSLTLYIKGDGDRNVLRLLCGTRNPTEQSYKDISRILWAFWSRKSLNYCSILCHELTKYFNKFSF